jgi:threonine dehydratase
LSRAPERWRWPGLKKYCATNSWRDKRIVAINSGANMNFDQLRYVAERSDLGQAREALLAVEIPEQPGSFLHFCEVLGSRAVTEFNYRYGRKERAQIFVGFGLTRGKEGARRGHRLAARFRASASPT